eukprot:GFUD01022092.1.p1 GENE.GFUD01022092.1~~GFUD01022092.1.p1  ORF type:complete len:1159 (+),score=370.35 GFUD01022092.1:112-3588(+)
MVAEQDCADEWECTGLGAALESFKEAEEVVGIIKGMEETIKDTNKHELAVERFKYVLDWYQEQPHLLDPHLESLLGLLVDQIRGETSAPLLHATTQLMAHLFKVRGPKVVVRYLPHEVEDLERVVTVLQEQDHTDVKSWETRYILLLWLSIIVLIPFNMARFDSGEKAPLAERLLSLCKRYLAVRDKCREAAATLVSTFLTRPDTRDTILPAFLDWAVKTFSEEGRSEADITGALMAICAVTKHAKREDMLQYADTVLTRLQASNFKEHPNTNIRKLGLKLVQRLGLIFLKAKVASWRYQRGSRSLAFNLNNEQVKKNGEQEFEGGSEVEEDYDIPDSVEDVIEELLIGLKDKDTIVRWSAAKGVGRVTGRLPKELADEVVGSLVELFSPRETDGAWHGSCLALAELGRRGLLLPTRLGQVVPHVLTALVYDERKGSFSVGSHIRDAACYVCWAFARAYDPLVLQPYVADIASGLLTVTVFDREVNCRRAASAAFQENVGRQGTFPHGIDILTVADYFAVGSRSNSFLVLSVFIAGYEEYSRPLVEHLLNRKVGHWDMSVRELTAKALHNLTSCDSHYVLRHVLPSLLDTATGRDLHLAHGSTLAAGQVLAALSKVASCQGVGLKELIGQELLNKVETLVDKMVEKHKLRGLGGELMRQAVSDFIKNISLSGLPLHGRPVLLVWQGVLEENLATVELSVQQAAVAAIPAFLDQYWVVDGVLDCERRDKLVSCFIGKLSGGEMVRRGFSSALGVLPGSILRGKEEEVIHALIKCSKITEGTEKWAEARRDAVKALGCVVCTAQGWLSHQLVPHVYDCFLLALEDYTVDRRGDTGAWVREAAMGGVEALTLSLLAGGEEKVQATIVSQLMPCLAQQATEKIARTRGHAGKVFTSLLWATAASGRDLPGVPRLQEVRKIFPKEADINWTVESETFPKFVQLLHLSEYSERILLGLIVSIGGLTERLVKNASESMFAQLRLMNTSQLETFASSMLVVFKRHQKVDRVTIPMFKFIDQLLTSSSLENLLENNTNQFSFQLFSLCKAEISKSGDPNKIMSSSDVFCQLLQSADTNTVKKCLVQLSIFLCHKFPRVRKSTAEKMYEALLTFTENEIVPEDDLDAVMELLSDTQWDDSVDTLRPIRNKICEMAGVPAPTVLKKTAE